MPISFTITVITISMAAFHRLMASFLKKKFLEAMIEISHANVFSLDTLGIVFYFSYCG